MIGGDRRMLIDDRADVARASAAARLAPHMPEDRADAWAIRSSSENLADLPVREHIARADDHLRT